MSRLSGPRPIAGVTLIEVLIALFIAAIGLLSLLTLFPAGLQNMGQAIQDNRSSDIQASATQLAASVEQTVTELSEFLLTGLQGGGIDSGAIPPLLDALCAEEEEAIRLIDEVDGQIRQSNDAEERASLFEDRAAIRFVERLLRRAKRRLQLIERLLSLLDGQ